jgi:hypothetical protein
MSKTRTHRRRHHKSKKSSRSFFKKLRRTTGRAIPVVASGLKRVGSDVKTITMKSKPAVERGLSTIYNTVFSGLDLGVKGVKKGIRVVTNKTRRHRK